MKLLVIISALYQQIGAVIMLLLVFVAFYFIIKSNDENKWKNKSNILTLIAICLFLLSATIEALEGPFEYFNPHHRTFSLFDGVSGSIWCIAQTFVYLLLILRLKMAFKNTKYEISKIGFIFLYIGLVLFLLIFLAKNVFLLSYYFKAKPEIFESHKLLNFYDYTLAAANIVVEFVDLFFSVVIVYLFIKRLMLITIESAKNNADTFTNYSNSHNKTILSSLINVIVKYAICSSFAIISTQILIFYWSVTDFISGITGSKTIWLDAYILEGFLWPTEMIINCVCIMLYLPESDGLYKKICHGCHSLCKLWFTKYATNKIEKGGTKDLQVSLLTNDYDNDFL